jgi:hypothetical protein
MSPHCFTNKIYVDLSISCSLKRLYLQQINVLYQSKLEALLVTSTLSEKFLCGDSGVQNQNFDFGI